MIYRSRYKYQTARTGKNRWRLPPCVITTTYQCTKIKCNSDKHYDNLKSFLERRCRSSGVYSKKIKFIGLNNYHKIELDTNNKTLYLVKQVSKETVYTGE